MPLLFYSSIRTSPNGLSNIPVLLSLHLNCYAQHFASAFVNDCGADCAIGWDENNGSIPIWGTRVFSDSFWRELCQNGGSVGGAASVAADDAYWSAPDVSWYAYHIYGHLSGGTCIYPSRWGQ